MTIRDLPLFDTLRTRMRWHESRHRLLAGNVANADTPGYRAKDLQAPRFDAGGGGVRLAATAPGHLATDAGGGRFRVENGDGFETTPDGNRVSLEEEMMKVTENQLDFQAAASLYQRGLAVLRIAVGKRA